MLVADAERRKQLADGGPCVRTRKRKIENSDQGYIQGFYEQWYGIIVNVFHFPRMWSVRRGHTGETGHGETVNASAGSEVAKSEERSQNVDAVNNKHP